MVAERPKKESAAAPACLAVAWAVWAEWTISSNDEGPDFFRAFFLVPQPREKCIGLPE